MQTIRYQIIFLLACMLSACSSAPHRTIPDTQAYWNNPRWQAMLLQAVQSVAHTPLTGPNASRPGVHGTVQFTFANGVIENPVIVKSTGSPDLDKLLLKQVASAKVPAPTGPHAHEPHEFELPVDMFTPYDSFEYNVYAAIDYKKIYDRESLLKGATGSTVVDFDYLDGNAHDVVITKSSGDRTLDKSSVSAVSNADLPPPPPGYEGKTVHLEVIVCYSLNNSKNCPSGKNVIYVRGIRYVRRDQY